MSHKTATSVLTKINTDGEHEFLDFGFDAEEKYTELLRGDEADKACLFSNFKLVLQEEVSINLYIIYIIYIYIR